MIITPDIFEAYLKCPSKCWFRFQAEEAPGNPYSLWAEKQNNLYREKALKRILDNIGGNDFISSPAQPLNIKKANWRLAADFVARKDNLEVHIPAVERLSSEGKPVQFIPIRFTFNNKLTKRDKLTLAFDSLVLSEAFRHEIVHGQIFYGESYYKDWIS